MKHKIQNLHEDVRVYRGKHKTGKSEAMEQIDAYQWFKTHYPQHALDMFHPVNEQKGAVQYQNKMNQSGRLKGVSDLIFLHPCNGRPYAVFELKRRHSGALSKEQKLFLNRHAEQGAFVCVCFGAQEFKLAINDYLHS